MEERLSLIYSLERKYGEDEAAVIAYGERTAAEAERLRTLEASRDVRQKESARLLSGVAGTASALSRGRQTAAQLLAKAVESALSGLGFRQTSFQVGVTRRPAGPVGLTSARIEGSRHG